MSENSTIYLEEIPALLAEALNVDLIAAQLIVSAIVLLMFLMPMILVKRSKGFMAEMVVGIVVTCFLMGIQWLPYWTGLIICLLVAVMLSAKLKGWLG